LASSHPDRYKWVALSNATLAVLLATLDASITIIAMPDIFRGIHLDPLVPANSFYLLWMILGYLVVTSVLIVSLGRLGDMVGRVRIYNLGFVIYTVASLLLAVCWLDGRAGSRRTSAGWHWGSTTSSACPACSSASCWAASSPRSTGAWCS
jgi:MFS family permease